MLASTLLVLLAATQPAEPAAPAEPAEGVDDPLGEIVVEPTSEGFRELPPFRVELVMLGEGKLAQEVHAAVTTDLLGFGRFIIVDDKATDDIHGKITVDVKALDDK